MIPILVINIDSAKERWENIFSQLNSSDRHIQRFNAVNGKVQEHQLFTNYDHKLRQRRKGVGLSRGQLGCFASHYLAWQKCVELDCPVIILEDDVTVIEPYFTRFLAATPYLDPRFECIRLFANNAKNHHAILVAEYESFSVLKYTKGPMSAMGYFLKPSGARKFIQNAAPWFLPVDIYMDRFWQNGVECFGLEAPVVKHEYIFESMIGYDSVRDKRPLAQTIKREWFAACESSQRFLHNLKFRVGFYCFGRYR